jgi:hypothetical protein
MLHRWHHKGITAWIEWCRCLILIKGVGALNWDQLNPGPSGEDDDTASSNLVMSDRRVPATAAGNG